MDGSIVIGIELEESGFVSALNALRQSAGQTAIKALGSLTQSIAGVSAALDRGASAGSAWGGQLTGVFQQVRAGAAALSPSMQAAGTDAGQRFLAGLRSADSQGAGMALAQGSILGFSSGNFIGTGAQASAGILQGLMSGAGSLTAGAAGLAALIRSAFSGGWYSVGYNISAGIASGVRGGSSLISSAAVSAAQSALAAAKRSLGVQSPSRVFREEVGRMIPAGIAEGIAQNQGTAARAVQQQSELLVREARRDVIPALPRMGGGQQAAVQGDGTPVQIHLEAPLYLDGRELARATAKYTGAQLLWEAM